MTSSSTASSLMEETTRTVSPEVALRDEALLAHERLVDDVIERVGPSTGFVPDESTENVLAYFRSDKGQNFRNRLSQLVTAFRTRTEQAKELVLRPLSPEEEPDESSDGHPTGQHVAGGGHSTVPEPKVTRPKPPTRPAEPPPPVRIRLGRFSVKVPEWFYRIPRPEPFDSHSRKYLAWLSLVTIIFAYNAVVIPYRASFMDDYVSYWYFWFLADYIGDIINLVDFLIWKPCIKVYINGIEMTETKEIVRKYVRTQTFAFDVLAVLPLDIFYLVPHVGLNQILRFLRLLKVPSYWELLNRLDQIVPNPYTYYFRVLRSVSYSLYLIHVNACVYYYYSFLRGFDPEDDFVYNNNHPRCRNITKALARSPYFNDDDPKARCNNPGEYNDYIYCFFFSVSMITIIGNLEFPKRIDSMVYSVILWFVGVFVFATLVGQIRDVLKAMKRQEDEFYELMDAIVEHMHTLKIPKDLQDRVRTWLLFNWEQQRTIDEGQYLRGLPTRLKSDLAMEVHFSVIRKVHLFRDVEKTVLEELLLKLKPTVFLPNDYICRKGEIGKEMYIIKSGNLEVVLPDGKVAVTLTPGSVFGEVSLLSLAGGNRRTADVRSKGFSNLYVLSKTDLNDVMKDYPDTLEALRAKAQDLLTSGKSPARPPTPRIVEVIPNRTATPEMLRVAARVMNRNSSTRQQLSHSFVELKTVTKPSTKTHPEDSDTSSSGDGTPEPIPGVPASQTDRSKSAPTLESTLANTSHKQHRRRHRAYNQPESPDSDEPAGTSLHPRRKPAHDNRSGVRFSGAERRSSSSTRSHENIEMSTLSSDFGMKEGASEAGVGNSNITNIKRRLFSSPKITPITSSTPSDLQLLVKSAGMDGEAISESASSSTPVSSEREASGISDNPGNITSGSDSHLQRTEGRNET